MTNKENIYLNSDGYTDHGHDHLGVDRGADLHPFVGYNFRISELHAAVGLAQVRKLNSFLIVQKETMRSLKAYSCKFRKFLTGLFRMRPVIAAPFSAGFTYRRNHTRSCDRAKVAGNCRRQFYWYDNNWHYIRKWDHLKNAKTLNILSDVQRNALVQLQKQISAQVMRLWGAVSLQQ